MTAKTAPAMRDALKRDGHVEVTLSGPKVCFAVILLVIVPIAIGVTAQSTTSRVLIGVGSSALWALIGITLGEWLFGAGPVLRVDRDGMSIRRWREPLVLAWTDVLGTYVLKAQTGRFAERWIGPSLGISMSQWVWHDYRAGRPSWVKPLDGYLHYKRTIAPYKVLSASHAELLEFLGADLIDTMTRFDPPFRLVVDMGDEGESPLWLRGGRQAPLRDLPLGAETKSALDAWARGLRHLADDPPAGASGEIDGAAFEAQVAPLTERARALARRCVSELGQGSEVLASPDVPVRRRR